MATLVLVARIPFGISIHPLLVDETPFCKGTIMYMGNLAVPLDNRVDLTAIESGQGFSQQVPTNGVHQFTMVGLMTTLCGMPTQFIGKCPQMQTAMEFIHGGSHITGEVQTTEVPLQLRPPTDQIMCTLRNPITPLK